MSKHYLKWSLNLILSSIGGGVSFLACRYIEFRRLGYGFFGLSVLIAIIALIIDDWILEGQKNNGKKISRVTYFGWVIFSLFSLIQGGLIQLLAFLK